MSKAKQFSLVPLGAALPLEFRDLKGKGENERPDGTYYNALVALGKLGLKCSYDVFHGVYEINGHLLTLFEVGELSDPGCRALRELIRTNFQFDPGASNMADAAKRKCEANSFHPIKDYLRSLRWDGVGRIDTFLIDFFGAADTPFNRAVSRIVLTASVRRIEIPGTKFDYITVLESPEGYNKSTALKVLYGEENFSDQSILGLSPQQAEETLRGMWGLECAELGGMRKGDQDKIKAQLSRTNDRVRRSYDRLPVNAKRTAILWGSTNDHEYLRAQSGENRRFFPVKVGRIDIDRLIADRDQIWAEAADRELLGENIMLPEQLWGAARAERATRTQHEPWEDELAGIGERAARYSATVDAEDGGLADVVQYEVVGDEERIASRYIIGVGLGIPVDKRTTDVSKRVTAIMREQGWAGPALMRIAGVPMRGYSRPMPWA